MKKKRKISLTLSLVFFLLIIFAFILFLKNVTSAPASSDTNNTSEWWMYHRYLNHTGWDGISYSVVPQLNRVTFWAGDMFEDSPAVVNGYVYAGDYNGYFYQLNASNIGQKISSYLTGGLISSSSPAVVNGYAYIASTDGYTYQFNASNVSQLISKYPVGYADSSPTVANGSLYIGNRANVFYQLNASNISQFIASYTAGNVFFTASAAIAGGYVYIGSSDHKLYQFNASNISVPFATFTAGDQIRSSPAVANGYLYIGSLDSKLYQLNASNISLQIASYSVNNTIYGVSAPPAVANGYVYIGGAGTNNVYQLNASNVSQAITNFSTTAGGQFFDAPTVANGYVYIQARDNYIYQLNASNIAQQIANTTTGAGSDSSPAVANGYVYIGSWDGYLYQLNATNISQLNGPINQILINITNPINGGNFNSISELDYATIDNVSLSSCWYSLNGGITNTTIPCGMNITGLSTVVGSNTWTVYANDTIGNFGSATTSFTISSSGSSGSGSSSSGGGSGGGSGGSTPTSATTSTISFSTPANVPAVINVGSSAIGLTQLTVTTTQDVSNAIVTVSTLPAVLLQIAANSQSYQSFQILTSGVTDSEISNVAINFQVNKSWVSSNNLNAANVSLYRNTGTDWTTLPTTLTSQDSQYYYFTAISPGFSNYTVLAQTIECDNGATRCLLNDSQVCSSNVWILSQHCQLGCSDGVCVTTSAEAVGFFQNALNNLEGFVNGLPGSLQLSIGTLTYYFLFIMILSGVVIVSTTLVRTARKGK